MIKLFNNFKKKDVFFIIIIIFLIIFQVWLDLKIPDYMSEITRLVETEGSNVIDILFQGGYMLLCALASLISAVFVGYFTATLSATFTKNIRRKLFNRVEEFGMEEIKDFSVGSLITRTTNDITNIQLFLAMGLQMIIRAPITAILAIRKILDKSFEWSALTGGAVFILLITVIFLMIMVLPKFKIIQKMVDKLNEVTRENLNGIRVIRAFNAEKYQEKKFEKSNNEITSIQMFVQKLMGTMQPIMFLIMNLLTLGIYFVGAFLINNANMMDKLGIFSNMVVFSSYAMQVIMSFLVLAVIFIMYPRASISANRVNEVLNTMPKIIDGDGKIKPHEIGTVEFKNVSFKYPDGDEYVIKDISFKVNKGQTVAFIGSTGSGKSTLINLIPRFYDVTSGSILVDGVDVRNYKLSDLHDLLGYISQKAVIFNGTIKYNVNYGNKKNKQINGDIDKALKIAQATDFVKEIGVDANVSRGGTNISGGQKQRLSIARAIAKDPEIFIFDDSFSALDYKTDYNLRKSLEKELGDKTILIVAQRIGTIKNADKIIVLDKGKCVGIGTHEELLKDCKVYQEIAYSQVSEKELDNYGK